MFTFPPSRASNYGGLPLYSTRSAPPWFELREQPRGSAAWNPAAGHFLPTRTGSERNEVGPVRLCKAVRRESAPRS